MAESFSTKIRSAAVMSLLLLFVAGGGRVVISATQDAKDSSLSDVWADLPENEPVPQAVFPEYREDAGRNGTMTRDDHFRALFNAMDLLPVDKFEASYGVPHEIRRKEEQRMTVAFRLGKRDLSEVIIALDKAEKERLGAGW